MSLVPLGPSRTQTLFIWNLGLEIDTHLNSMLILWWVRGSKVVVLELTSPRDVSVPMVVGTNLSRFDVGTHITYTTTRRRPNMVEYVKVL